MKKVLDCCKAKMKCEGGDEVEEDTKDDGVEKKKRHGGCGAQQPKISIDGMKIQAEFKPSRKKQVEEQDQYMPEPVERKQLLSAERVCNRSRSLLAVQKLVVSPLY